MISPDHPLVSITVTRAPAAARPPPSAASLFTRCWSCYSLPPAPRYAPPDPDRDSRRRGVRKPARDISHRRTTPWIHSVLLLLRIPSRACGSFRALESCRDPAKSRTLHLPRISAPTTLARSLARLFRPPLPLDFDLAEHCEHFALIFRWMKKEKNYRSISHGRRSHLEGSAEGGGKMERKGEKRRKKGKKKEAVKIREQWWYTRILLARRLAGNGDRFQKRCLTSKCDRWIGRSLTVSREDSRSWFESGDREREREKELIMLGEYEIQSTRLTIEGPRETRARVTP